MTATQRVPQPPSHLAGHEGALALAVLIAILAAIAKPWGAGSDETEAGRTAFSLPSASPSASAQPEPGSVGQLFDAAFYGPFEPPPEWSIWPAGYFVSVRFITRASDAGPGPSPLASGAGSSLPARTAQGVMASPSPAAGPDWPSAIDVGPGDHLLWLGINTPSGWSIGEAVLRRVKRNGTGSVVSTTRLPSPWEDHFTILGMPTGSSAEMLAVWPAGDYRLDLTVSPGDLERTIAIRVRTAGVTDGGRRSGQP